MPNQGSPRFSIFATLVATSLVLMGCETVESAIDPDCTPEKAAKSAAMKTTIGVGNRCTPAETARDVTGTDGMLDDAADRVPGS